jgi:alpha-tubulin suppressor-like RCC1 family protein
MSTMSNIVQMASGTYHTLTVTATGQVYAFGLNTVTVHKVNNRMVHSDSMTHNKELHQHLSPTLDG